MLSEFLIAVLWYAAIVSAPVLMFLWLGIHVLSDHLADKRFAATLATEELAESGDVVPAQDLRSQRTVDRLVWVIRHPGARARSRTRNAEQDEPRQRQAA